GIRKPPGQARKISKEQLKIKPFFLKKPAALFSEDLAVAQTFAMNNRFELLAKGFPTRTFGIGANKIDEWETGIQSFDMMTMKSGWPDIRPKNSQGIQPWRHSDFKDVAYVYTYLVFNNMVDKGGLK
ncbi:MAG TPA: hypothetical protein PK821_05470, partial [Victivallales bacterium]|nr:hypothetical protein [Victivallales bacterium]